MTIPPQLLVCPECGTVCYWNNRRHIMTMLKHGAAFILLYCPYCEWHVEVPELNPDEKTPDWPF